MSQGQEERLSPRGATVMVAGASSGMGQAIAESAAASGWRVIMLARNHDRLEAVASSIRAKGGVAEVVVGDATSPDACARAVEVAAQSPVAALVNCVGKNVPTRALTVLTTETWSDMLRTNLDAAFNLTQAVLPTMRSQGGGLLIHMASRSFHDPDGSGASYQASKAGVVALARATAIEERSHGIRVSVVYPGMTDTPLVLARPVAPTQEELDRALKPEDVARVVQLLLDLPARAHIPDVSIYPTW